MYKLQPNRVIGTAVKPKTKFTKYEHHLMAQIIHREATKPYRGMSKSRLAVTRLEMQRVAEVVLNRIRSRQFPNNITGVLRQRSQFTPCRNWSSFIKTKPSADAVRIAKMVLVTGYKPSIPSNVLYFTAKSIGRGWRRGFYTQTGGTNFYR